jgi:hypothetical protein
MAWAPVKSSNADFLRDSAKADRLPDSLISLYLDGRGREGGNRLQEPRRGLLPGPVGLFPGRFLAGPSQISLGSSGLVDLFDGPQPFRDAGQVSGETLVKGPPGHVSQTPGLFPGRFGLFQSLPGHLSRCRRHISVGEHRFHPVSGRAYSFFKLNPRLVHLR